MCTSTIDVIDRGMRCLSDNLGFQETELFIATILRERFDYTKWRRSLVDSIRTSDELDEFVAASADKARFSGSPTVML